MKTISRIAVAVATVALLSASAFAQIYTPQGRLTPVSDEPVLSGDEVNVSTIYYTPYVGNTLPAPNGSSGPSGYFTFSQLALTLTSANNTAGNIYDIFIYGTSSPVICTGPAWFSSDSRGTGTGTTQIEQLNGIWVNVNSISSCYNNGTSVASFAAGYGLYVGSVYMTADGETSIEFKPTPAAGGTSNVLGLYNAYNRVRTISRNIDSAYPAWTYSTASWELLDNGNSTSTNQNTISFLDGLNQSFIDAQVQINIFTSSSSVTGFVDVSLDSTTPANPGGVEGLSNSTDSPYGVSVPAFDHFTPQLGFHYVAAVQYATGSTVTFFNGSGGTEELKVELEM